MHEACEASCLENIMNPLKPYFPATDLPIHGFPHNLEGKELRRLVPARKSSKIISEWKNENLLKGDGTVL